MVVGCELLSKFLANFSLGLQRRIQFNNHNQRCELLSKFLANFSLGLQLDWTPIQ